MKWVSDNAVKVEDFKGDSMASNKVGTDIVSLSASCDSEYLAFALDLDGSLDLQYFRNYFLGVDFEGGDQPEYQFGFRPNGDVWVFDQTINKNNWNDEPAEMDINPVFTEGIIEGRIPRKKYNVPDSFYVFGRVTEGGPTVDFTKWFNIGCIT